MTKKKTKTSTSHKKAANTKQKKQKVASAVAKKKTAPVKKKTTPVAKKAIATATKSKNSAKKATVSKSSKAVKKVSAAKPKKSVKKASVANPKKAAPQKETVKTIIKPMQVSAQKQRDITLLANLGTGLDMMAFKYITLGGQAIDIVYSSSDAAVLCKVFSDGHHWKVNTSKSIQECTWKDETGMVQKPCAELLAQVAVLKKLEPNAKIIPALVLMSGSIEDEEKVIDYLSKNNIRLVKYRSPAKDKGQTLQQLLMENFSFDFAEDDDPSEKSAHIKSSLSVSKTSARSQSSGLSKFLTSLSTLGPIGYFPKGPGTMGSLMALPLAYVLNRFSLPLLWIVTLTLLLVGYFAVHKFTADKKEKDPGCVIIDEVVGQLITFFVVIPDFMHWPMILMGFLLFRFFDIVKFGPVAFWDRRKNPVGVMMDDVMAGVLAGFVLAMLQVAIIQLLSF